MGLTAPVTRRISLHLGLCVICLSSVHWKPPESKDFMPFTPVSQHLKRCLAHSRCSSKIRWMLNSEELPYLEFWSNNPQAQRQERFSLLPVSGPSQELWYFMMVPGSSWLAGTIDPPQGKHRTGVWSSLSPHQTRQNSPMSGHFLVIPEG